MKISKKFIIPSLAVCMGAALVGSISGTVAWYQYSTRSQVSMTAVTAGGSENLEIKIGSEWKSDLTISDIETWLASTANTHNDGTELAPTTTGKIAKNVALGSFYGNPIYQIVDQAKWFAAGDDAYIELPLKLRVHEKDGENDIYPAKQVYLNDVKIAKESSSTKDITDAIRVHVNAENASYAATSDTEIDADKTYYEYDSDTDVYSAVASPVVDDIGDYYERSKSNQYGLFANVASTDTHGYLDLNNDGEDDLEAGYEWENVTTKCDYGSKNNGVAITASENKQAAYNLEGSDALPFAGDADPKSLTNTTNAICLGESSEEGVEATVTIWLEGWQELDGDAIWSTDYIGSSFHVGLRFCCEA